MSRFTFQINGKVVFTTKHEVNEVTEWISKFFTSDGIELTGITVYKIEEKNPAHKGIARKKGL